MKKILSLCAASLLISLLGWADLYAQNGYEVKGVVVDALGPVIGATVLEQNTSNGVSTGIDGDFVLKVSSPSALIEVGCMGYATQVFKASELPAEILLKEDSMFLEEAVAIGYGSQKKKEVTGSVASVKAEDFNAGVKTSPVGLLQGKVAGLNISRTTSDPTSTGYNIQIRGFSTLGKGTGSSPLYIVDGIPTDNIDNVPPEDIASMDVLKDGSAAAIYGTRGTNGVILITTKRGAQEGEGVKTSVEYNGYLSVSAPRLETGLATPEEYRQLETLSGGLVKPVLFDDETNTDWMKLATKPAAITHNHNVAISGASSKFSYRASANYKYAEGLAKNTDRNEISGRFAADQTALKGWLKLAYDMSYMHYKNNYDCGDFKQAAILNPTYPVMDENTLSGYFRPSGSGQSNPIMATDLKESNKVADEFRGSIKATIDIKAVPGLKLNAFAAIEANNYSTYSYTSQKYDADMDAAGSASQNRDRNFKQLYEATVDYVGSWQGHALTVVGGWSYQKFLYDGNWMSWKGFPTDSYKYYSMGDGADKEKLNVSSYRNSNVLAAAFARANYNYMEKYLLSLSLRAEGSSRFGENHKWGLFPAVSAGWRISGEPFMENVKWVNDLKLRFGFGVTGNNLGSDLQSKQLLTNGGAFWYKGEWINTYGINQNANPDLRWEKKYEYNIGIDFSFLDNRLYGSIDAYYRDTKDLLWEYDVPTPPFPYNKLLANCGEITSRGIEFAITGVPVKIGDWTWETTLTMAFNNNRLNKLTGDVTLNGETYALNYSEMLCGGVGENGLMGVNTQKIVEGASVGTFYGYHVIGLNGKGGLVYEKDENGRNKLQKIGSAQPIMTYGWNNTIRWKSLDLTLFFRGNVGNKILNVKRWAYGPQKSQGLNCFMYDVKKLAEGTGAYRQGVFSDYYLESGSFLKLDNITLGYTHKFQNEYISSLRVFATAENVFTITKYSGTDPDVNTSDVWSPGIDPAGFYPSVCNVMVGLNLTF